MYKCVCCGGLVSGPRLSVSVSIYGALLVPIISPVAWPFSSLLHSSNPSHKTSSSVCVCVFLRGACQRVSHSLCHSSSSETDSLKHLSQSFLLYSSIAVLGTREQGFILPSSTGKRDVDVTALLLSAHLELLPS